MIINNKVWCWLDNGKVIGFANSKQYVENPVYDEDLHKGIPQYIENPEWLSKKDNHVNEFIENPEYVPEEIVEDIVEKINGKNIIVGRQKIKNKNYDKSLHEGIPRAVRNQAFIDKYKTPKKILNPEYVPAYILDESMVLLDVDGPEVTEYLDAIKAQA